MPPKKTEFPFPISWALLLYLLIVALIVLRIMEGFNAR